MKHRLSAVCLVATITVLLSISAAAADWPCTSGNPLRNAQSAEVGPSTATLLWSSSIPTLFAHPAFTEGGRVYAVNADGNHIECLDLSTGTELWKVGIPTLSYPVHASVAGVWQGRLYASRACGSACHTPFNCFDSTTGAMLWQSTDLVNASFYAGMVFAPNGDPVIGGTGNIHRIDHLTGTTVWLVPRPSWGQHCGVAVRGQAVYSAEGLGLPPGYLSIVRRDLATGAVQYASPQSIAWNSSTNTPMIGPDGTVYLAVDTSPRILVAWIDTGSAFVLKWSVPIGVNNNSEFGIGPDGSVYVPAPLGSDRIARLDPSTGGVLNTSISVGYSQFQNTRFAIDTAGMVFVSSFPSVYSFEADLTLRWSALVYGNHYSGPALAQDGTLVIAGYNAFAWRDPVSSSGFCAGDGSGPVACPCSNAGASGHGCANSVDASGALLEASGIPSISADSVLLRGSGMPDSSALYFQGTSQMAGGQGSIFGDGLRCAGGSIILLGTRLNVSGSSHYPGGGDPPISVRGLVPAPGGVRTYQAWYRNAAPYCTPWTFNLTNGAQITWIP